MQFQINYSLSSSLFLHRWLDLSWRPWTHWFLFVPTLSFPCKVSPSVCSKTTPHLWMKLSRLTLSKTLLSCPRCLMTFLRTTVEIIHMVLLSVSYTWMTYSTLSQFPSLLLFFHWSFNQLIRIYILPEVRDRSTWGNSTFSLDATDVTDVTDVTDTEHFFLFSHCLTFSSPTDPQNCCDGSLSTPSEFKFLKTLSKSNLPKKLCLLCMTSLCSYLNRYRKMYFLNTSNWYRRVLQRYQPIHLAYFPCRTSIFSSGYTPWFQVHFRLFTFQTSSLPFTHEKWERNRRFQTNLKSFIRKWGKWACFVITTSGCSRFQLSKFIFSSNPGEEGFITVSN